jgi:tRNA 2-thiouridine synthesizing protein A
MDEITPDQEIDLRGEVCPYTFVKTKLALEMMHPGEVLKVTVDHPPAVENVPRSVTGEGHQVLEVCKINATDWVLIVQKGVE